MVIATKTKEMIIIVIQDLWHLMILTYRMLIEIKEIEENEIYLIVILQQEAYAILEADLSGVA